MGRLKGGNRDTQIKKAPSHVTPHNTGTHKVTHIVTISPQTHSTQRSTHHTETQHTQTQTQGPTQSPLFCSQPQWAGPQGSSRLRMGKGGHLTCPLSRTGSTRAMDGTTCLVKPMLGNWTQAWPELPGSGEQGVGSLDSWV